MNNGDERDHAEEASNRADMEREGREELNAEAIATQKEIPSVTQWACQCCTLVMANGECCDSNDHGGDGKEPLSDIPDGAHTTLGMLYEEHANDCLRRTMGRDAPDDYECDCEQQSFSWRSCDACGSNLGGSRDAFVIWTPAESATQPDRAS